MFTYYHTVIRNQNKTAQILKWEQYYVRDVLGVNSHEYILASNQSMFFALIFYVLCVRCIAFQPTYIDEQNEQKLHHRMLQNRTLTPIYIRSHFLDGAIPKLWPNGEDTATGTEP